MSLRKLRGKKNEEDKGEAPKKVLKKKTGWLAVGAEAANKQAAKVGGGGGNHRAWDFFVRDGEEALCRITDANVRSCFFHEGYGIDGKFHSEPCNEEDDCAGCAANVNKNWKAIYPVFDYREWEDKKGVSHPGSHKIWKCSKTVYSMLDRIDRKKGLENCILSVERHGTKTNTRYDIMVEEEGIAKDDPSMVDPLDVEEHVVELSPKDAAAIWGAPAVADDEDVEYDYDDNDED